MNHYDEMTCLLYLDGQMDRERAGELEQHAEACAECARLLRALRSEGALLSSALRAESEAVPARLQSAPWATQPIPWGWFAGLGFAAMGAYSVWAGVIEPGLEQFNRVGLSENGILAVLLLGGVFWKGWESVMTLMNILALGTLLTALGFVWRKYFSRSTTLAVVMSALVMLVLLPATAGAAEIKREATYTLPAEETVKNDLIIFSRTARIDGTVEGDLIFAGQRLTVTGHVTGDVLFVGQELRVDGRVDGNLRVAGNTLTITGQTLKNVSAFGANITFDSKSNIGGSLTAFTGALDVDGNVNRDVLAFFDEGRINGIIGGSADMAGKTLALGASAEVHGKTKFYGQKEPTVSAQAKLASPVEFKLRTRKSRYNEAKFYWEKTLGWGAVFLFGLVLLLLFPGFFRDVQDQQNRYGLAFGSGFVTLVAIPVLAILACLTYVGFALGVATMMVYIVTAYAAQVFVGLWIGQRLLGQTSDVGGKIGRLALGLLLIRVLWNLPIPYMFFYVAGVVTVWGLGGMVLALLRRFQSEPQVPAAEPASI
jgi:cytoskeletal protein CcmA (bactofilin family)